MLRAWCLGSEEFRNEILAQMSEQGWREDYGQEIHESAEQKKRFDLSMGRWKRLGSHEGDLVQARKRSA